MNGFQVVSLSIAVLFCLIVLVGVSKKRITRASALLWVALWIGAATAIINPEWTRIAAELLGIDRGADLVFYFAILAMFVGFFLVYAKLRRLEQAMTLIVREMAIEEGTGNRPCQ